jgi:hypothetical protein
LAQVRRGSSLVEVELVDQKTAIGRIGGLLCY